MLSADLQELAELLEPYRDSGCTIDAVAVCSIVARLNEMSARADTMERLVVPFPARLAPRDLPPNVVLLERRR
jgi:hypothetical protein